MRVTPTSPEDEPASVAPPKGAPAVGTVANDRTRNVDNSPGNMGEDLVEALQLDLTYLKLSWASLRRINMTSEDF